MAHWGKRLPHWCKHLIQGSRIQILLEKILHQRRLGRIMHISIPIAPAANGRQRHLRNQDKKKLWYTGSKQQEAVSHRVKSKDRQHWLSSK